MTHFTLKTFCTYLKENYPVSFVSYPVALRLVKEGKIKAIKIGAQYRITYDEMLRFAHHGNWDESDPSTQQIPSKLKDTSELPIDFHISNIETDPYDPTT